MSLWLWMQMATWLGNDRGHRSGTDHSFDAKLNGPLYVTFEEQWQAGCLRAGLPELPRPRCR